MTRYCYPRLMRHTDIVILPWADEAQRFFYQAKRPVTTLVIHAGKDWNSDFSQGNQLIY